MKLLFTIIFSFSLMFGFSQQQVDGKLKKMFTYIQDSNAPKALKASASKAINALECEVYNPWTGECDIPSKKAKSHSPAKIMRSRIKDLIEFDNLLTRFQSQSKQTQGLSQKAPKVEKDSKQFLLDMMKRLEFFANAKNFGIPVGTGRGPN